MIHSITFRRWKSFLDTTLYLDQIMVLIGMNASGKSNVLDALSLLKALADGEDVQTALSRLRGGAELATLYGHDSFELEVEIHQNENDNIQRKYIYCVEIAKNRLKCENLYSNTEDRYIFSIKYQDNKYNTFLINDDKNLLIELPYDISILGFTQNYIKSTSLKQSIRNFISCLINVCIINPIPSSIRDYVRISSKIQNDGSNIAGVIAALDDSECSAVEAQLTEYLIRLPEQDVGRVWVEKIGRLGSDAMLYCEETWPNGQKFIVDTRGMSDGTLRFLAILTALLTRPEGSNLIIEEVDNGLHPSRAKLLLEMLREIAVKRQIDVLVTTHNPALLDAMTPDYIGFITVAHRNPQGYSELTLLDEVDALPKLLASGRVGYLATTGKLDQAIEDQQEQGE